MDILKEKRKVQPKQAYLAYFTILLLVMSVISAVWFVVDWLQPLLRLNPLARFSSQEEINSFRNGDMSFNTASDLWDFVDDNLPMGNSSQQDVIEFMQNYLDVKYAVDEEVDYYKKKKDGCEIHEQWLGGDIYCTIVVSDSITQQTQVYIMIYFGFDRDSVLHITNITYDTHTYHHKSPNLILGMATVVFLLGALGAGWRVRFHPMA